MRDSTKVSRATWTLIDQGVVSLGVFLVNVRLARGLSTDDYGTYALLFGAFLGLQLVNSSLLLYPMSIRIAVLSPPQRVGLFSATVRLVLGSSIALALVLACGVSLLGRPDLALPALAVFLCWQIQETARRGLLAEFRHRTALIGDSICYLGQVVAVWTLAALGLLTLRDTLLAIAGAWAIGAAIQLVQVGWRPARHAALRETARTFWQMGAASLANNLLSLLRIQVFPWALAAGSGAAAAASFQAALNIVNLANPIILGLCNVIPQTAAQAQTSGTNRDAWRAARVYMLIGVPPTFGYFALVFLAPTLALGLFYGWSSPYATLSLPVRLLVIAWAIAYAVDMVCSYLHGVNGARLALVINGIGATVAVLLAVPLTQSYGLTGACVAMLGANVVRLLASQYIQRLVISDECLARSA